VGSCEYGFEPSGSGATEFSVFVSVRSGFLVLGSNGITILGPREEKIVSP
jgi:hypothetical protein